MMTFKELKHALNKLTKEQLEMTATVGVLDYQESFAVREIWNEDWNKMPHLSDKFEEEFLETVSGLDENHPVILV